MRPRPRRTPHCLLCPVLRRPPRRSAACSRCRARTHPRGSRRDASDLRVRRRLAQTRLEGEIEIAELMRPDMFMRGPCTSGSHPTAPRSTPARDKPPLGRAPWRAGTRRGQLWTVTSASRRTSTAAIYSASPTAPARASASHPAMSWPRGERARASVHAAAAPSRPAALGHEAHGAARAPWSSAGFLSPCTQLGGTSSVLCAPRRHDPRPAPGPLRPCAG